jgi:hypothetical protein
LNGGVHFGRRGNFGFGARVAHARRGDHVSAAIHPSPPDFKLYRGKRKTLSIGIAPAS